MDPCAAAPEHGGRSSIRHGRSTCTAPSATYTPAPPSRSPTCQSAGQGTVEYVALILLVALVMAGMVAAMKGFKTGEGKELGDVILSKIKQAVRRVQF